MGVGKEARALLCFTKYFCVSQRFFIACFFYTVEKLFSLLPYCFPLFPSQCSISSTKYTFQTLASRAPIPIQTKKEMFLSFTPRGCCYSAQMRPGFYLKYLRQNCGHQGLLNLVKSQNLKYFLKAYYSLVTSLVGIVPLATQLKINHDFSHMNLLGNSS